MVVLIEWPAEIMKDLLRAPDLDCTVSPFHRFNHAPNSRPRRRPTSDARMKDGTWRKSGSQN